MDEEPTDDATEWEQCALCGGSLNQNGTPRFLDVSMTSRTDLWWSREEAFCSWDHLATSVAQGEPVFEKWQPEPSSRWSDVRDAVENAVVLVLILVWSGLAAVGTHTVLDRLF